MNFRICACSGTRKSPVQLLQELFAILNIVFQQLPNVLIHVQFDHLGRICAQVHESANWGPRLQSTKWTDVGTTQFADTFRR